MRNICGVPECDRYVYSLGFCRPHCRAFKKYGDPLGRPPLRSERFWEKVQANAETGCWEWTGNCNNQGYGMFWDGETKGLAHRFAFIAIRGPVPDGCELDHLCRNTRCVNPAHLDPVSHSENLRRGYAARRHSA